MSVESALSRDESRHFGEAIYNDEDGVVSAGIERRGDLREFDDEVEGNGLPRTFGDGELLEKAVGLVSRGLRARAGVACRTIIFDKFAHARPIILTANQFEGLAKALMTGGGMIVFFAKDTKAKVVGIRDIDATFEEEKT